MPGIISRIQGTLHRFGVAGMAPLVVRRIRERAARKRGYYVELQRAGEAFDREHGTDTCRTVHLASLQIDSGNKALGLAYMMTPAAVFKRTMGRLGIECGRYAFMDYGSGKGRVLLLAAELGFQGITGVEFSAELCEIARRNIAAYAKSVKRDVRIEVRCEDAALSRIPPGDCVLHLYNPFREEIVSRVAENIGRSLAEDPRDILVVYHNPQFRRVFDRCPFLKAQMSEVWSPDWYVVYRGIQRGGAGQ